MVNWRRGQGRQEGTRPSNEGGNGGFKNLNLMCPSGPDTKEYFKAFTSPFPWSTQPQPHSRAEVLIPFPPSQGKGVGQQDISFPRKSLGQISRTKVSIWSRKKTLPYGVNWGKGGRIPVRSFQVPGLGVGTGTMFPPAAICLAGYKRLHFTTQEK